MVKTPENDYAAHPQSDQLRIDQELAPSAGEQPGQIPETPRPVALSPEAPSPAVEDIMSVHAERTAERGDRWGQLSGSNWPEGRIKQALDREFPELRSAEDIERSEVAQIRSRAQKAEPSPSKHPPTRYVSPRDKGAPDHIVKKIRGE